MLIKLNIVKNYVLDSYFLIILNKKQIDYTQKINKPSQKLKQWC